MYCGLSEGKTLHLNPAQTEGFGKCWLRSGAATISRGGRTQGVFRKHTTKFGIIDLQRPVRAKDQ